MFQEVEADLYSIGRNLNLRMVPEKELSLLNNARGWKCFGSLPTYT